MLLSAVLAITHTLTTYYIFSGLAVKELTPANTTALRLSAYRLHISCDICYRTRSLCVTLNVGKLRESPLTGV